MTMYNKAQEHKAYNDALATAVRRAAANRGDCFSVYFDGEAVYVRATEAAAPKGASLVCIVQAWDANTVQLRFAGARSEWRKA